VPAPPLLGIIPRQEQILKPVAVNHHNISYALVGSARGNMFKGSVFCGKEKCGAWTLSSISVSDLRQMSPLPADEFDLREWLRLKGSNSRLSEELDTVSASTADNKDRQEKLKKFLSEQDLLKSRAAERKEGLLAEITSTSSRLEVKQNEVKQLERELDQLSRITRRGQAIELERRVAKREAKWYQVNWQAGADLSSIEENLAQKMNVDLLKLRANVKKAAEVRALKNQIAQERAQIAKLQHAAEENAKPPQRRVPERGEERREQPRPWWQRWDSVFGGEEQ